MEQEFKIVTLTAPLYKRLPRKFKRGFKKNNHLKILTDEQNRDLRIMLSWYNKQKTKNETSHKIEIKFLEYVNTMDKVQR